MSDFHAMRQRLVEQGLIDAGFRLTAKGNAHTDSLIAELRVTEADDGFGVVPVRWNTAHKKPNFWGRAHG